MRYEPEPYELVDVPGLRTWTLNRLRNRRDEAARFMLVPNDRKPGTGFLDGRALGAELYAKLDARWPRSSRTGGKNHLSPAGVFDLVGHSGPLKVEAKRLRALDDAWSSRLFQVSNAAESAHLAAAGHREARDAARAAHQTARTRCTIGCRAPLCCREHSAWRRALDDARGWLHRPHEALDGRTPDDMAGDSEEGLARALFALEAVRAPRAAAPTSTPDAETAS